MPMPGATPPAPPPGGAAPTIPTDLIRLLAGEAATGGALGMPDYGTPTTFTAPTDSVKKRPEPKPSAPAKPPEPVLDLAKRRGQEFVQGASGILQSVARARGIKEDTLAAAIKRDAPDRVKEAARRIQSLEGILSRGISDSGVGPMTDQERAKYQRDLAEAGEAFKQWSDVQEFGPAFAGNRTKQAEKTAKTIKDWTDENFGVPPEDDSIWSDLAYGGGSMVGFVAPAVLAGPLGLPVTAQMGSDVARVEAYDRAIAAGASDEDAQAAANLAGLMGTMEAVPIGHALNRLPKPVRDDVIGRLGRFARESVLDGTEEAMQEAFAALSQNLIAKGIYDPEQKVITSDITDQALVGFILGAFLGGSVNIARRDRDDEKPKGSASPDVTPDGPDQPGGATGGDMDYPRLSPMAPMPDTRVNVDPSRPERPPELAPGAMPNRIFSDPGKINSGPKSDRYEVIPEIYVDPETGEESLTGRNVRVDTTGQEPPVVVDGPAAERDTAEGSGPGGSGSSARPVPDADAPPDVAPRPVDRTDERRGPERRAEFDPIDPNAPRRPREVADGGDPDAAPAPDPQSDASPAPGPQRVFLSNDETLAIGTDADAFQYKGGGDAQGVTDRLQGVTSFDPERAGRAIVYEKADGSRVIADGHQRLGLAKRAAEAGQSDVGGMAATVYREADGYSAADVRVIAALKNIAEGSGTALDAARILRDSGQSLDGLNLPPKSALVRDAEGLRRLSDGAFGMVANGVATEQHGAIVGREVADQDAHASILKLLGRLNPRNAEQAAIIARDAAADTAKSETADLFGSQKDTDTLYLERARVLDSAVKGLKKDKATFSRLVQEGDKIEGAGNKLDADANTRRVEDDAKVLEYLQRQANTKGPISDALSKAARDLKAGRSLSQVAKQFVGDVQGALSADGQPGDTGGRGSEATGPRPEAEGGTPEGEVTPAPKPDTDLFGEKPVTDKERAEAQMSKPKRGGDAPPPGGRGDLFGDPADRADLFDRPDSAPRKDGKRPGEYVDRSGNKHDDAVFVSRVDELPDKIPLDQLASEARRLTLEPGRREGIEFMMLIDPDGQIVSYGSGGKSETGIPAAMRNLFSDPDAGLIAHHNHPSSNPFSPADYHVGATAGFRGIYAHLHDGTTLYFESTERMDNLLTMLSKAGVKMRDVLRTIKSSSFKKSPIFERLRNADDDQRADAWRDHSYMFMRAMDDVGLIVSEVTGNPARENSDVDNQFFTDPELRKTYDSVKRRLRNLIDKYGAGDYNDRPTVTVRHPGRMEGISGRDAQRGRVIGAGGVSGSVRVRGEGRREADRGDGGGRESGDDFEAALAAQLEKRGKGPAAKKDSGTSKPATPDQKAIKKESGEKSKASKRSAAARTKDIKNILKGGGLADDTGPDPVYEQLSPIFSESIETDPKGRPRVEVFGEMIGPMLDEGLTADEVRALRPYFERFLDEVDAGTIAWQGDQDAAPGGRVEPDSGAAAPDGVGADGVPDAAGSDGQGDGAGTRGAGARAGRAGGERLPGGDAASVGGRGRGEGQGDRALSPGQRAADGDAAAGRDRGEPGLRPDDGRAEDTRREAADSPDRVGADPKGQPTAHHREVAKAVPALRPEQVDDVVRIERRFFKPEDGKKKGLGMLITNGTGTGKTMTGLGAAKRFVDRGAKAVLVVVKTQGEVNNWVRHAGLVDTKVAPLQSTTDNGKDAGAPIVVTTYANIEDNKALVDREWDFIVSDESHMLMSNAQGEETKALRTLRTIANKPSHLFEKELRKRRADMEKAEKIKNEEARQNAKAAIFMEARRASEAAQKKGVKQSNVLFMSATPFAYDKNVDYAEGYLFNYPESETREGSRQDGRTWFMVENFGYRVRYHKLTQPEAAVDRGVFHREFHERLKREGSLWGRKLDVPTDYDRKFVTVSSDLGNKIETALDYLRKKSSEKNADPAWRQVEKRVQSSFRYHQRQQLLEAIKAKEAMADIRKHVDMGRKVVVFHDFNVGGGTNPFSIPVGEGEAMYDQYMQMYADLPWLADLPIERMAPPKEQVLSEFGARAREYNGTVSKKERQKAADEFNRDGSGVDVIVVQSDAGSGGISLHDTTGGHKRVLINLGMPVKPTTSLQAEGRTRRVGSVSDSPYRYYTIGTTWERQAFARRIAEQSGAVENLAMGNEARAIKQSFIDAYEAADRNPPSEADGKGGLQKDTVANNLSDFDRAKSHYFGRQKMKGKRDQRKGFDFFPTPEPLGYKMAEWAQIRPYDKVLEPSAGDGAISRYFPEHADRTILEPEADLLTKAELRTSGARARGERFEDLPIVNKYDAVVMNPPFGRGGKLAFEHVEKAMMHTRPGGRVVALVPKGPAATKQFELMMDRLGKAALEWNMVASIDLPAVAFERAGTAVRAEVMIFDRIMDTDGMRPTLGLPDASYAKDINEFFNQIEDFSVPDRPPRMGASGVDADMDAADAAAQVEVDRPSVAAPLTGDGETVDKFDVFEFDHSQTGEKMFGAQVREKLGRERYKAVAAVAKQHGGYYSKYQNKDAGAKRGFLFKTDAERRAFIEDLGKPVQGLEDLSAGFREETEPFQGWPEQRPPIPGGTAMDFDAVSAMLPKLRAKLDAMNLKRVTLNVEAGATGRQGMTYARGPGQIDILISQALDPEATLYHESIHAMRAMNLFTPQEWDVLRRGAEKRWIDKHDIRKRYPDLTPSEQIEEAIAEEFAEVATTRKRPGSSFVVRAFNKIHRFLKALRSAVQGNGMQTADDIFGKALAGQIGARDAGNTGVAATLRAAEMRAPSARQMQRQQQQAGAQPLRLPPHIPDRRLWDELTASNASIFERLRGAGGAIYDAVDKARFQVQDRMLPVLRAQQAIENAVGAPLPNDMNAYQTEVTYSGKAGRKLFEVDEEFTKPIIGIIAKSKGALDAEIVGQWLTARHAEERNRQVASINPSMPDGGSGMTNAEARAILAQWAASPQAADLQRIGDLVDKMRDYTLRMRLESGLMSARDYMIWKNQYDFYVPLKGYAEVDGAEGTLDMSGIGRRYNTRGPESMRALGRGEGNLAFNPLVAAITQAKEVAIRSEKNRVGQALYRLAKAHPSKALWTVKTPKQKRYYNRTTGLVETRVEPAVTPRQEANEFAVKIEGKEHRVVFHDQRLTEAINNVGYDGMQGVVRWLGAYTRFQSAVLTMLNPEFVVRNAFRDFQTALINLPEMTDQKGFGKAVAKNWRKAFMGVYRGMGYKDDTEWSRHYREFEESGAKISFWTLDDPVVGRSDLEKRVDLARGPRAARILKAAIKAPFSTRDNKALGWIERVNLSVDNAVRLAAFVEARKRGMSQQDAANLSKNLTVNFNRRGKQVWLNSVFLFFNAAMQGMQTFARVMFSKHGLKVGGALLIYGMVEDMVNAALSEEDDDGELAYDKIPDYQSNRNFIWMARGGDDGTWGVGQMDDAWKIPMPYVYSLPVVYGRKISQVLRGVKDKDEAFLEAALATASDVSPLQFGSPVDMVTPTLLKDALEFRNNEDWLDRPIRPEYQFNDYGPMAYKHYVGVSELSRVAADKLNRWTGGNAARSGWLDVSPEYIDHAIGTATGSAGTFWMDSIDIALKAATGATGIIEPHRIPFVSEVSLETGPWLDRSNFFERYSKVMDAKKRVKIAGETGEPARPEHYILEEMSKKAAKLFKARGKLDDQRMSVRLNRDLTQEERAKEYKRIERELQPIYDEMNRVYLRLEKEVPDAIPDTSIWRDRFSYDQASFLTYAAQDRITAANEVDGLVPLKDLAYSQLGDIVEQSQKRVADLMDQRVDVRLDDTLTDKDREKRFAAIDAQLQPIYRAVAGAATEMEAGIVTSVTDGDTFRSGKLRVRLSGINAPEMDEPGGEAAKQALADMIYGKPLLCSDKGKDTFGRQLASCRIENGEDIGTLMISIGKAVPYRH